MKEKNLYLGIDVGSVSVKCAIVKSCGELVFQRYVKHAGRPGQALLSMLRSMVALVGEKSICGVGITGSGGARFAPALDAVFINEVIADTKAVRHLCPDVHTIINIGGQDSKLIQISPNGTKPAFVIDNFSMNTLCAAGTGAFLDQQAIRLGIPIENEFGRLAMLSEKPPRIAGRCSVFAKSDMIHLQQRGAPESDIVAGLCYAVARNFKSTIGKNTVLKKKVAFIGGVAENSGMVKAFREILGLLEDELIVPPYNAVMGAIGAALNAQHRHTAFAGFDALEAFVHALDDDLHDSYEPLTLRSVHAQGHAAMHVNTEQDNVTEGFLGIDIGSISTNIVVLDKDKNILEKKYLRTEGRPIEAVKKGLAEIKQSYPNGMSILRTCVTGSGRHLIGDIVGADLVKNEISAHARGAVEIDANVDTIIEIGGQDSKYICLENGTVVDFEMNKVCAAGTGSFLEEQADRLGVCIEDEFASLALNAKKPCRYGERCTVFMESDLVHHQQNGALREDIIAGLCYAIVHNYLNKVVENRKIGSNIFFQGGVAFNKGVIAAFEKVLNKPICIPPHHEVLGALGCALLAMDDYQENGARA